MSIESSNTSYTLLFIDKIFGAENIRQFREDLKVIVFEKMEKFQKWQDDKQKLQHEALQAARRAKSSKLEKVGLILGIFGALTFFLPVIPLVTSFIGALITIVTTLRRVAVEVLIYPNPHKIRNLENVKFACAWNRAMEGWTSFFVVPLGIFAVIVPDGYRIGLWLVANHVESEY